jgi:MFS family permease
MQPFASLRPGRDRALDLVNFFVADVQTGFGPFVAVYLTTHKWTQVEIGFALTLGTVTSLLSQLPAGVLVDSMRNKRMAASGALVGIIVHSFRFWLRRCCMASPVASSPRR